MMIGWIIAKNAIKSRENITKKFKLKQIMEITKVLDESDLSYTVEPELHYSKFYSCEKKLI